ncbi:MAG: glycoside hydrolase family 3 protein [Treponemataceae bacterium]
MRVTQKKIFVFILFYLLIFFQIFAEHGKIPDDADFWSDYPNAQLAEFIVNKMDDKELLAQIFMFGWDGGFLPYQLQMDWVSERAIGSMKIYGWNTHDEKLVAKSVTKVQQAAAKTRFRIPLYIATDQEGGWIRHIKGNTSDTPGNLAIGAGGLPIDAYYTGYYIAKELRALGINMNFAPTVDIYSNLNSSVIGPRSFGSNQENTAILGSAFARGMLKAGVIPTAKHFPGHGDTDLDSHGKLPEIQIDEKTFEERELLPFKYLIKEEIPAIMSGHLSFPKITGTKEPATLSKYFLQKVLREKLNYKGLIITDDMMMNGANSYAGNLERAFRMAIEAGNDIIISSTTAGLNDALWVNNCELMGKNPEFKNTVKKAVYRVILSKLEYFKGENPVPIYPDIDKIDELVPDPEGTKFFTSQACRSITAYNYPSDEYKIMETDEKKILIAGPFENFVAEGLKYYPNANRFWFNYKMGPNEIAWTGDKIYNMGQDCSVVIIGCANENGYSIAKRAEELTKKGVKVIIVSMLSPTFFMAEKWNSYILMSYSYSPYTFKAVFSVLKGEFEPKGVLPLEN